MYAIAIIGNNGYQDLQNVRNVVSRISLKVTIVVDTVNGGDVGRVALDTAKTLGFNTEVHVGKAVNHCDKLLVFAGDPKILDGYVGDCISKAKGKGIPVEMITAGYATSVQNQWMGKK